MNVKSSLRLKSRITIRQLINISLYTSLICVFTILIPSISISGIPITLQTLMIILIANIAKPYEAFISVILYLLLGIIGLPVFSGLNSGIGVLFGPTGGFLISFPLAALLISLNTNNKLEKNLIINIIFGIIFIYLIGTIHMAAVQEIKFLDAVKIMAMFIPIDIVKVVVATILGLKIKKSLIKTSS